MTLREFRDALRDLAPKGASICGSVATWIYSDGREAFIWSAWIDTGGNGYWRADMPTAVGCLESIRDELAGGGRTRAELDAAGDPEALP